MIFGLLMVLFCIGLYMLGAPTWIIVTLFVGSAAIAALKDIRR
jgi:hypothetical protein